MNRSFAIINILPDEYRNKNVARIRKIINWPEIKEIDFVNGWDRGEEWMASNGILSTSLLLGELGCVASAVEAWKYIVDSDYDEVLVLENDAIISNDFIRLFDAYRSQIPNDFDAFSLCAARRDTWKFDENPEKFNIGAKDVCRAYQNWPSNSILYTRAGAKKALDKFKSVKTIDYHVDVWILEHSGLDIYTLKPTAKRPVGRYLGVSMANPSWTGWGEQIEW